MFDTNIFNKKLRNIIRNINLNVNNIDNNNNYNKINRCGINQ